MTVNQTVTATWAQLATATTTLIVALVCAQWALLAHHEDQPHKDAVHVREFERIRDDIREIKEDLRAIRKNGK